MPRPSIIGTPASTAAVSTATIDVAVTVPVGADVLVCAFGGFAGGSAVTVTSVQDVTGTPINLNSATVYNQRGNLDQYAGKYALYSPTTGARTIRVTISSANRQLKACCYCLDDVDIAGTPVNGSPISGDSASSVPSLSMTSSSSNALNVACVSSYSADTSATLGDNTTIHSEQNGGSASSLYVWHEDGTASTDTVECSGTVAWSGVAISFEGTGGAAASASLLLLNRSIANNGGMRQ